MLSSLIYFDADDFIFAWVEIKGIFACAEKVRRKRKLHIEFDDGIVGSFASESVQFESPGNVATSTWKLRIDSGDVLIACEPVQRESQVKVGTSSSVSVSYTHLTLPTIYSV